MTEVYVLRSKTLLDSEELVQLSNSFQSKYAFGIAHWHEGQSLNKNGWTYSLISNEELSVQDLDVIKEKGLTLLLKIYQAEKLMDILTLARRENSLKDYPIEIINSTRQGTGTGFAPVA